MCGKTYIVEQIDPELGPWSTLEYHAIATNTVQAGPKFYLSSVPKEIELPQKLVNTPSLPIEHRSVEETYQDKKDQICLLDPADTIELSPDDAAYFDVFLFGRILSTSFGMGRQDTLRDADYI
jgi:ribosome biogenesis SPOUT family RNA methylase Rps3